MIHFEQKQLILVGKIISPHSLYGMVKIISYMQNKTDIFKQKALMMLNQQIIITSYKLHQNNIFICKIKDINTRTDAEKIVKNQLFVFKSDLPELQEDEFYIDELKGMDVVNLDGKPVGLIHAIYDFGAGQIVEIKFNNGSVDTFPFTHAIFPKIDDVVTFISPKIL